MASGGSKLAIYSAIVGNTVVMIAKFAGWLLTGSGAMLSEGIHSFADVGNQVLLAVGLRSSQRSPDAQHPYGYGREAFVWSLMSAVGIFFLGCGVTLTHGVQTLFSDGGHEISSHEIAIGILVFSLVVEGISWGIAMKSLWSEAVGRGVGFWENLRTTDDPFGIAVLLEDSAAVLGVIFALFAVLLTQWTHNPDWDAYGTLAIGLLLGAVALFLISKNRALLLGRAIRPEDREKLAAILEADPAIQRVVLQKATVAGVDDYRVSAEIDFDGAWIAEQWLRGVDDRTIRQRLESPEGVRAFLKEYGEAVLTQTGKEIDRIEGRIREEIPRARHIALEPD